MPVVPTARTKAASGLRLCVYARWLFYKLKRLSAWMVAFTHRFSTSLRFGTMQYTAPLLHHSFRLYRVVFPCENPPNSLSVEIFAVCISLPRTWSRVLQSCPTFCCVIFCCLKAPCHKYRLCRSPSTNYSFRLATACRQIDKRIAQETA